MQSRGSDRIEYLGGKGTGENWKLLDLSATGAAFICPTELSRGSRITVRINGHRIAATVIHTSEMAGDFCFRIGLRFENVPAEDKKWLADLVEEFSRGVPLACEIVDQNA
ncbi:MAG: PilZ domain-containing protein [Chitinispirillaceae bacterium]|jgi:hypothetical protein|nr:PilZ domain-containing protein [Chitinispirillaceae bacterium]